MLRAAKVLMEPGSVHELRVLKADSFRTISGYFNSGDLLAKAAANLDGKYPGVYITLNPCQLALLSRSCNRTKPYAEVTTKDKDILKRRWFLIDCDPKRPAGISSTDSEHKQSIEIASGILEDLRGFGFPHPVVADSGNGAHLLYRVDCPNSEDVTTLFRKALLHISRRSSTSDIEVDSMVYNPARICKLYGTMAKKGDSTPERPHRRSSILEIPEPLEVITIGAGNEPF